MKNADKPIYPCHTKKGEYDFLGQPVIAERRHEGITFREHLISLAFQGHIAHHGAIDFNARDAAWIIKSVDELLKQLEP